MSSEPVTEDDLHAYADGQLEPARRALVEAHLAAHADAAATVRDIRAQGEALHRAYDGVLNEPVPARLTRALTAPRRPPALAAGIVWLACGLAAGWLAHGALPALSGNGEAVVAARFAHDALRAHVIYAAEQRHPVEVPAQQEAQLVAWLSKRLQMPIHAPDLNAQGFALLGGRLLPADGMPLAQLMYQAADGERLTLTIRNAGPESKNTGFRIMEQNGNSAFYWIDRDYGYALSGGIGRQRLLEVANAVQRQLQP